MEGVKGEMYGVNATFFSIIENQWDMCLHHSDMTNSQKYSSSVKECVESMSDLQTASHIKQMYFVNVIP